MVKRVEIKEAKLPTKNSIPWTMTLERNEEFCHVFVTGGFGGKKAVFTVKLADLKNAVEQLEE